MSTPRAHSKAESFRRRYGKRQQQRKEERAREFEAVFSDPDLDLEEVAAQVGFATCPLFKQRLSRVWTYPCCGKCSSVMLLTPDDWLQSAFPRALVMCRT